MVWGAIGSIGAAAIGAGASIYGASQQAAATKKAVREANEFTQKMMQSRYQWTMADMRAAGLNPMLAYQQGGGGIGASPTYQPPNIFAGAGDEMQRGIQSAIAQYRAEAEVEKIDKELDAMDAQIANTREDTKLKNEHRNVASAEWMLKAVQQKLAGSQVLVNNAQALKLREDTIMQQLNQRIAQEMEAIRRAEANKAGHRADIYKGLSGKILTWIDELISTVSPFASSARDLGYQPGRR